MRYIHINEQPPKALLTKAAEVTKQLEAAKTDEERKAIIDKNRKVYRRFHDWLLKQSNGKCWFSDTDALFVHFDVEHYRPKKQAKDLDGTEREGYWWLAFDWKNLRICGNVGNRKKGAYFPLRDPATAANSAVRDLDHEAPYLLDPSCFRDTVIVEFNELGKIVAAPHTNAWDQERLRISVERYGLDFHRLEQARIDIWTKCQRLISQCQNQMKKVSQGADGQVAQYFERLGEMVSPDQPLSSVAISCLLASGLGWAQRIAVNSQHQQDNEVKEALLNEPLYTAITRPRLRFVLRAIDTAMQTKKTEGYTLKKGLTIEHLLPQHWEKHWPLTQDGRESDEAFEERKATRHHLLHTIGNLTLLTSSLNPLVSNGAFKPKRKAILDHSVLNLNRFLSEETEWDEKRIKARASVLFRHFAKVWPHVGKAE